MAAVTEVQATDVDMQAAMMPVNSIPWLRHEKPWIAMPMSKAMVPVMTMVPVMSMMPVVTMVSVVTMVTMVTMMSVVPMVTIAGFRRRGDHGQSDNECRNSK